MDALMDRIQFHTQEGACWSEPGRRIRNRLYLKGWTTVHRGDRFREGEVIYEVVDVEVNSTGYVACEIVTIAR